MAKAPTTGVMMKGSSDAAMKTPFQRVVTRLMPSAKSNPPSNTRGKVMKV